MASCPETGAACAAHAMRTSPPPTAMASVSHVVGDVARPDARALRVELHEVAVRVVVGAVRVEGQERASGRRDHGDGVAFERRRQSADSAAVADGDDLHRVAVVGASEDQPARSGAAVEQRAIRVHPRRPLAHGVVTRDDLQTVDAIGGAVRRGGDGGTIVTLGQTEEAKKPSCRPRCRARSVLGGAHPGARPDDRVRCVPHDGAQDNRARGQRNRIGVAQRVAGVQIRGLRGEAARDGAVGLQVELDDVGRQGWPNATPLVTIVAGPQSPPP